MLRDHGRGTYAIGEDGRNARSGLCCSAQAVRVSRAAGVLPQARRCATREVSIVITSDTHIGGNAVRTFGDGHADEALALLDAVRAERLVQERVVLPRAVRFVRGCRPQVVREQLREWHLSERV